MHTLPTIHHTVNTLPFSQDRPWLAPLAGYSDLAFRLLCRSYGAACCTTEMVSAKGLIYQSRGTAPLLATCEEDSPLIVQLFGAEKEFLRDAVLLLKEAGYSWFDLNIGCSVPKVMRQNAGAGMLRDPGNILDCVRAMLDAAGEGHVGCKLRLGLDPAHEEHTLPCALADLGVGWITLHPRYADQHFQGTADWSRITSLARRLPVPLVASGDLLTAEDGLRCLEETGAATLMYARGAMRNPAVFEDHLRLLDGLPPLSPQTEHLRRLLYTYLELVRASDRGRDQTRRMRGILASYVRGRPGAREIRIRLCQAETWDALYTIIDSWLDGDTGADGSGDENTRS